MDSAVEPQNDTTVIFSLTSLDRPKSITLNALCFLVVLIQNLFYYSSLPGEAISSWRLQEP